MRGLKQGEGARHSSRTARAAFWPCSLGTRSACCEEGRRGGEPLRGGAGGEEEGGGGGQAPPQLQNGQAGHVPQPLRQQPRALHAGRVVAAGNPSHQSRAVRPHRSRAARIAPVRRGRSAPGSAGGVGPSGRFRAVRATCHHPLVGGVKLPKRGVAVLPVCRERNASPPAPDSRARLRRAARAPRSHRRFRGRADRPGPRISAPAARAARAARAADDSAPLRPSRAARAGPPRRRPRRRPRLGLGARRRVGLACPPAPRRSAALDLGARAEWAVRLVPHPGDLRKLKSRGK